MAEHTTLHTGQMRTIAVYWSHALTGQGARMMPAMQGHRRLYWEQQEPSEGVRGRLCGSKRERFLLVLGSGVIALFE